MPVTRSLKAAYALLGVMSLTGCGDGGGDASETQESPSVTSSASPSESPTVDVPPLPYPALRGSW